MSQRALQRRLEQHTHDTDDDESATDREIDRDVLYARGRTKCGDPVRRRLIEEVGRAEAVTFIGEAAAAGRQATEIEDENASDQEDSDDTN